MEDGQIIELYFRRDEEAIRQTQLAYGGRLYNLSYRLLLRREDAEESVSDTYLKAWETIPPTRPVFFYAYLAKICRFLSMGKLDWNNAAKRKAEVVTLSDELACCIPDVSREQQLQSQELGAYWYADSIAEIAQRFRLGESNVKTKLMRTRNALRAFLEKEGVKP